MAEEVNPPPAPVAQVEIEEKSVGVVDAVGNSPLAVTEETTTKNPNWTRQKTIHFIPLCITLFCIGWVDATFGPLLPRIQEYYHLNYTVVSVIFIAHCSGCIAGAVCNLFFTQRLGFGKMITFGAISQIISFAIQAAAPPYAVFIVSSFIGGLGTGIEDAQASGFVAGQKESSVKMGIMQSIFACGALLAPVSATMFSRRRTRSWSFHYLVSLGIGLANLIGVGSVFRLRTQQECYAQMGESVHHHEPVEAKTMKAEGENEKQELAHYKQVLRTKWVYIMATFLFVYVGVEVAISSWTVTYVIEERNGGPSSGFISTGFFAGLTLGRVLLLWVNAKVGEARVVYIYVLLCLGLQLIVWLVDSLILGGVCISLIGVLLGPIYPIAMNVSGRTLPPKLLAGSIGLMCGVGAAGAAAFPFLTGAIASGAGIGSLQPILIAGYVVLMSLWFLCGRVSV